MDSFKESITKEVFSLRFSRMVFTLCVNNSTYSSYSNGNMKRMLSLSFLLIDVPKAIDQVKILHGYRLWWRVIT